MDKAVQEFTEQEAEAEEYKEFIRKISEDRGIDSFFLEIVRQEDISKLSKVGNLNEDELGTPLIPVRTLLELKRDCEKVPSMSSFTSDFENKSKEILATSLSKDGFLIKTRVTQKKELLDKPKKKRKGFSLFGSKEETEE